MSGTYPSFDDSRFNFKIYKKKEFNDYQYKTNITDKVEEEFETLCNKEFELTNHQIFVKNFLSPNTPYNGYYYFMD